MEGAPSQRLKVAKAKERQEPRSGASASPRVDPVFKSKRKTHASKPASVGSLAGEPGAKPALAGSGTFASEAATRPPIEDTPRVGRETARRQGKAIHVETSAARRSGGKTPRSARKSAKRKAKEARAHIREQASARRSKKRRRAKYARSGEPSAGCLLHPLLYTVSLACIRFVLLSAVGFPTKYLARVTLAEAWYRAHQQGIAAKPNSSYEARHNAVIHTPRRPHRSDPIL